MIFRLVGETESEIAVRACSRMKMRIDTLLLRRETQQMPCLLFGRTMTRIKKGPVKRKSLRNLPCICRRFHQALLQLLSKP